MPNLGLPNPYSDQTNSPAARLGLIGLMGQIRDEMTPGPGETPISTGLDVLNRGVIGANLGLPVDVVNAMIRPLGLASEEPIGGAEWIGKLMEEAGMVSPRRRPASEIAASFIGPADVIGEAAKSMSWIDALNQGLMYRKYGREGKNMVMNRIHGIEALKHIGLKDIDEAEEALAKVRKKIGFRSDKGTASVPAIDLMLNPAIEEASIYGLKGAGEHDKDKNRR